MSKAQEFIAWYKDDDFGAISEKRWKDFFGGVEEGFDGV